MTRIGKAYEGDLFYDQIYPMDGLKVEITNQAPQTGQQQREAIMKTIITIALLALSSNAIAEHPFSKHMKSYSASEQKTFFTKFLQQSGERCKSAKKVLHIGLNKQDKSDYWSVDCGDRGSYMISVKNDADMSSRIMDCAVYKAVGGNCWKKF